MQVYDTRVLKQLWKVILFSWISKDSVCPGASVEKQTCIQNQKLVATKCFWPLSECNMYDQKQSPVFHHREPGTGQKDLWAMP